MEIGTVNLWGDCKDCDSVEGVKDHLQKVIVNQTNMFYHKPHYSSKEACKYLKIKSVKTLHNLCALGQIAYSKPNGIKYFLKEDLDAYIQKNRHRTKYL